MFFQPSAKLDQSFARAYTAWLLAALGAIVYSAIMLSVLLGLGLWWPALIKGFGLIVWIVALICLKRSRIYLSLLLAISELFMHSTTSIIFFGEHMGFHTFLILAVVNVFFLPKGFVRLKIVTLSMTIATIIALQIYIKNSLPFFNASLSIMGIVFISNWIFFVSVLAIIAIYYRRNAENLENRTSIAYQKAEDLLLNILPNDIAQRLKSHESNQVRRIIDTYAESSVLFCDISGFTSIAHQVDITELIYQLDQLFCGIDDLCDQYDLEKIKTIGDAYMLCSGCPRSNPDHALRAIQCGVAIIDLLHNSTLYQRYGLDMRIGMHSGPVVAGVIGKRKFSFDLWGSTVSIANQIESLGTPGLIHLSAFSYELIKDHYHCTSQGVSELKGVGAMETWIVQKAIDKRP